MISSFKVPDEIVSMAQQLKEKHFPAYLVGGCVRDAILGKEPHDYDLCTSATPDEIISIFGEENCKWYGKAFGTVCVTLNGESSEITTFRKEADYADGRHPNQVSFSRNVLDDLSRRDFTCNAICYDPVSVTFLDPYHGIQDIQQKTLRAVGAPNNRFQEDSLRILRGMRFCSKFGFSLEKETAKAMHAHVPDLVNISKERILTELSGFLMGTNVREMLDEFPDVLCRCIPEIAKSFTYERYQLILHQFYPVQRIHPAPDLAVRFAILLQNTDAERALQGLCASNELTSAVCELLHYVKNKPHDKADVRRLIGTSEKRAEQLEDLLSCLNGGYTATSFLIHQTLGEYRNGQLPCAYADLAVNGHDMIALGLKEKSIGKALELVYEAVIHDEAANKKSELIQLVKASPLLAEQKRAKDSLERD